MKKIFFLSLFLLLSSPAFAATRTISNAGGSWNTTAAWTEGVVPTAADDVIATALSGNLVVTASSVCRSFNMALYTGTISGSGTWSVGTSSSGNFNLTGGVGENFTATSTISFVSTTTGNLITTNGFTTGPLTFNGVGGNWQLQDALTSSGAITITKGTFDSNGKNITATSIASNNANTRTWTPGASVVSLSTNANCINFSSTLTITASGNTSAITCSGASVAFVGGGLTFYDVAFTGAANATTTITGANTFHNLTITGTARVDNLYTVDSNQTISNTLTLTGNSNANKMLFKSDTFGTQRTITCNGSVSITDTDFTDIVGAGTASPFTGTRIGNAFNNSGITFTTGANQYWFKDTGNWNAAANWFLGSGGTGGAGRVPLPQDTAIFDASSFSAGSKTITMNTTRASAIDFSAATNSPSVTSSVTPSVYGALTLATGGMTATNFNLTMTVLADSSCTMSGHAVGQFSINNPGKVVTLADAYSSSTSFTLTAGTLTASSTVSMSDFSDGGTTTTKTLNMGNSNWTISKANFTPWAATGSGTTLNANGSTLILSDAGGTAKTFDGGGKTYNNLSITGGGAGVWTFTGANTFAGWTIAGGTKSIKLPGSTTTTITASSGLGNSTNVITFTASAGSATISSPSGNFCWDYVNLTNIPSTGGATFYAGANSTDGGGNTGWSFTACPAAGGGGVTAPPAINSATIYSATIY